MTERTMKPRITKKPVAVLREDLRLSAERLAEALSHSVGRKTSDDELPCLEYGDEVKKQYTLTNRLLYVQCCRKALEACVASGHAGLRFRRPDGVVVRTWFRRTSLGRVATNYAGPE